MKENKNIHDNKILKKEFLIINILKIFEYFLNHYKMNDTSFIDVKDIEINYLFYENIFMISFHNICYIYYIYYYFMIIDVYLN